MVIVLAFAVVLVVAVAVIRAAAKAHLDDVGADLAHAWIDVEGARATRRETVGDLVALVAPLADDLDAAGRRVLDTLRREQSAGTGPVSATSAPRVEQRLMSAVEPALALAEAHDPHATARLRAALVEASEELAESAERWNALAEELNRTASSFPGALVSGVSEEPTVRLGRELRGPSSVRRG